MWHTVFEIYMIEAYCRYFCLDESVQKSELQDILQNTESFKWSCAHMTVFFQTKCLSVNFNSMWSKQISQSCSSITKKNYCYTCDGTGIEFYSINTLNATWDTTNIYVLGQYIPGLQQMQLCRLVYISV